MEKAWFEMRAETRRRLSGAAWIPLKLRAEKKHGKYGQIGYVAEFEGAHSVAIRLDRRHFGDDILGAASAQLVSGPPEIPTSR